MTGKHFFKKWLTPKGRKKEHAAAAGVHIPPTLKDDDDGGFLNRVHGGHHTSGQGGILRRNGRGNGSPQHRTSWPNRGARNGFVPYEDPCVDYYPPPPVSDTCSIFSEDSLMITPSHSMSSVDQISFYQEQDKMTHASTQWHLVDRAGKKIQLPQTMIFLGREECDIKIQSRSVDKRHAVLNYDQQENKFKVKDLGSINGTYVNDNRIVEGEDVTLNSSDSLRFGYDPMVYRMERIEEVPALEHMETILSPTKELPGWATSPRPPRTREHPPPHSVNPNNQQGLHMAECPGCIAEQEIRHTCGISEDSLSPASTARSGTIVAHTCQHDKKNGHGQTAVPPSKIAFNQWQEAQAFQAYRRELSCRQPPHLLSATTPEKLREVDPRFTHGESPERTHPSLYPHSHESPNGIPYDPKYFYEEEYMLPPSSHPEYHHSARHMYPAASNGRAPYPHYMPPHSHPVHQGYEYEPCYQCSSGHGAPGPPHPQHPPHMHPRPYPRPVMQPDSGSRSEYNPHYEGPRTVTTSKMAALDHASSDQGYGSTTTAPESASSELSVVTGLSKPAESASDLKSPQIGKDIDTQPVKERSISLDQSPTSRPGSDERSPAGTPGSPTPLRRDQRRSLPGFEGDLETVKKGTPLYGQPSWWGEDDADYRYPHTSTISDKDKPNGAVDTELTSPERPNSLALQQNGASKQLTDPKYGANMEIPQKDMNGTGAEVEDTHQQIQTPPERDTGPGSPQASMSATAFTVDLGDDKGFKIQESVSGYLPPRLRRSLRQRQPKREEEEGEETNGNVSPTRQRKFDSTWSPKATHKSPKLQQRSVSEYHSDGHNSALSSDNEDISTRSDNITTRGKKTKTPPARGTPARSGERKSSVTTSRSTSVKSKTPTSDAKRAPQTTKTERKTPKAPTTERKKRPSPSVAEPTYLIDKMYSGEPEQDPSSPEAAHLPTEYELYKEAKVYDRAVKSGGMPKPVHSASEPRLSLRKSMPTSVMEAKPEAIPDNLSETGTYTIETEKDEDDYELSRKSIDKIFGLDDSEVDLNRPVIDPYEGESPNEESKSRDGTPTMPDTVSGSVQATLGSDQAMEELDEDDQSDPAQNLSSEAPKWVAQWASLAQKPLARGISGSAQIVHPIQDTVEVKESVTTTTHAPISVPLRKRGTGRRLPTPPCKPAEPSLSPHTFGKSQTSDRATPTNHSDLSNRDGSPLRSSIEFDKNAVTETDSPGRHRATVTFESDSGSFSVSFDAPQRETPPEKDTMPREDTSSLVSDIFESSNNARRPMDSVRSTASLDTEVLLKDTEHVMNVIQDRVQRKKTTIISHEDDQYLPFDKSEVFLPIRDLAGRESDSDASSSCCVVDGDMETPRTPPRIRRTNSAGKPPPRQVKSRSVEPRPTNTRARSEEKASHTRSSMSRTTTKAGRKSSTGSSYGADVESQSEAGSIISSSTDYSETSPKFTRKASGGKGNITMIRTNRAFAIRRQKADGGSDTETSATLTPRSRPGSAGHAGQETVAPRSQRSTPSARSRSTSRTRPTSAQDSSRTASTNRTDVSLGQKIVQKSRDNQASLTRKDGGRHSLRSTKSLTPTSSTKETKSRATSARSSTSSLTVSGHRTAPTGGAQSPRSQEMTAWQRRKGYDPRKAAAEARSKKVSRSKSATEEGGQDTLRSVSSASSEDGYDLRSIRTDEIVSFSSRMADQIREMSKTTAEEDFTFRSLLGSDSHRSAFSPHKILRSSTTTLPSESPSGQISNNTSATVNGRTTVNGGNKEEGVVLTPESYDNVVVSSIFQLSRKVKDKTDRIVEKLKRDHDIHNEPSPTYEGVIQNANPELAGILSNLRKTEHQLQVIDKTLYSCGEGGSSPQDPDDYLRELEKIRRETGSFRPIERPTARSWGLQKQASSGSDPLGGDDYY